MIETRPRVMMSAFACEPDEGSEPEVGWRWAQLMARSCEVTVITQEKNRSRIDDWYARHPEIQMRPSFEYIELGAGWRKLKKRHGWMMHPYYWMWQFKLRTKAAELMQSGKFDLIHHVTFASFRMPVFVRGIPMVWGPVGGGDTAPWGLVTSCGGISSIAREAVRNLSTSIAGLFIQCLVPLRRTSGIAFASTPATARLMSRSIPEVRLMPTIGFDPPEMPPVRSSNSQDPLKLLYVGRLHPLKGLHLVLPALASLPDDAARLTIVGSGQEKSRLEHMVAKLGLGNRVHFAGAVPREHLRSWFDSHDLIIAPSLYESGGLAVLEAFARGMPAIVLDRGGHALSVGDGCGIRVNPSGLPHTVIQRLKRAISAYVEDRNRVRQDGLRAYERLIATYSWENKHDRMLDAYREICPDHFRQ